MKVGDYEVLEGLYYTKEHEWLMVEGDKGRIGICDYAQKSLHEIVYVELPKAGSKVSQAEVLGSVESVKAVAEVYSPVSGEVVEVNERLTDNPELVNESPYGEGWIAVIKPLKLEEELKNLMDDQAYASYLKETIKEEH